MYYQYNISHPMKLVVIVILLTACFCLPRFPQYSSTNIPSSPTYNVSYYTQKTSHFSFKPLGTFQQKYFVDDKYWNKSSKGPIIFYCGNEGPVEMFYNNSGFYNEEVAKNLSGVIVYMEHRYFGVSMPFGSQKQAFKKQNLVYLTTEEATMDYVEFLQWFKERYCENCPVIAFGGSYAGMLAVWMRMKYPHVVDMAHGASAPIFYFKNRKGLDYNVFYQIVTKNYQIHSSNCPNVIREGFRRLISYYNNASAPINTLTSAFNLCKPLRSYRDIEYLIDYVNNAYAYMAMLNYPYPTNFLKKLPAWPANSSCIPLDSVTTSSNDTALFTAIRKSIQYYYNYNGTKCNEIYEDSSSDEDMSGWNILACSDEAMPMDLSGIKDMFYNAPFDYSAYNTFCNDTYGIVPDYQFTLRFFGGRTDSELKSHTRIFFTNGNLDPWSGASPLSNITSQLPACVIELGAHHLDLRPRNSADPPSTDVCRDQALYHLNRWLREIREEREVSEFNSQAEEVVI